MRSYDQELAEELGLEVVRTKEDHIAAFHKWGLAVHWVAPWADIFDDPIGAIFKEAPWTADVFTDDDADGEPRAVVSWEYKIKKWPVLKERYAWFFNSEGMGTMRTQKLNDREREMWVLNDEGLYRWWKQSRLSMRKFIRENREELDAAINRALGRSPSGGMGTFIDWSHPGSAPVGLGDYADEIRAFINSMSESDARAAAYEAALKLPGSENTPEEELDTWVRYLKPEDLRDFLYHNWNVWSKEHSHAMFYVRMDRWVNTYLSDRAYGGPEEGGWWYDVGEPIESIYVPDSTFDEADEIRKQMEAKWEKLNEGRRPKWSVVSEGVFETHIEDHFAEAYPKRRPHYE